MSASQEKLCADADDVETLKSVLSHENSPGEAATGWHPEEGKQRSDDIDKYLKAQSAELRRQIKVLVHGMNEPKNIFWKQMKLLEEPLTEHDRVEMAPAIRETVLNLARNIAEEVKAVAEGFSGIDSKAGEQAQLWREVLDTEGQKFAHKMNDLLGDPSYQGLTHSRKPEYAPASTAHHIILRQCYSMLVNCSCWDFPGLLRRISAEDYVPSDHDYLHFDHRFKFAYMREALMQRRSHMLRVLDLRNGMGERRKWIHLFEDTRCVVFPVDLMAYHQDVDMDSSTTYLHESIVLFESVARSRWLDAAPVVLILVNAGAFKKTVRSRAGRVLDSLLGDRREDTEEGILKLMVSKFREVVEGRGGLEIHVCDELTAAEVQNVVEIIEKVSLKDQ